MKRFLSILLALMMVLSSVSFAAPSLAGVPDTAYEVSVPEETVAEESEDATLAAVDNTQYGKMVLKFTFENLTVGTDYLADFKVTTKALNNLNFVGGELGAGAKSGLQNTTPFVWDGENTATNNHAAVVARQDANGNKYIELKGTGSDARFGIRDYNGTGFAAAGHYILTADVLSTTNKKPFYKAHFQDGTGDDQFKQDEYINDEITLGEWSTIVISQDDTHDYLDVNKGTYDHANNTVANYIFFYDKLAAGEVVGIDNITLWWIPATCRLKVHNEDGTSSAIRTYFGQGIKTIKEIESFLSSEGMLPAGKYLKGVRLTEDGEIFKDKVLITGDTTTTQVSIYPVWGTLNLHEASIEFSSTDDFNYMKTYGGTRPHAASHASYWSDNTANGYVTYNVVASDSNIANNVTNGSYKYAFVHDAGYMLPYAQDSAHTSIPAGSFKEFEIRLRYNFSNALEEADMSASKITYYNARYNNESSITPTSMYFPARFYLWVNGGGATEKSSALLQKKSMADINGKWFTINLTAEQLGADKGSLDDMRFDLDLPHGTTIDVDYIRFINDPLPEATVDLGGKYDLANAGQVYTADTTVADVIEKLDIYNKEVVVGLSRTPGGEALALTEKIGAGTDDITLYAIWGPNPELGEYGKLVFEINFDKLSDGPANSIGGKSVLSVIGGKTGKMYASNPEQLVFNNGSGTNFPEQTLEVAERADGDKYLKVTTTAAGNSNLLQIYTNSRETYYVNDDGYLVVTYDILWGDSAASKPHEVVYNRSQAAEAGDQNEMVHATKNGGWGHVVSTFDDNEIGVSGLGGNSATMQVTGVNFIKIHGATGVVAGETYGIDNIRLWWLPKTVNVTVEKGNNSYVSSQTFSINPATETVSDLVAKVNTGNAEVSLAGVSLTEGGELLASDALLSFAYDTTLYPKWAMPAQVTVDMGDNTSATPVQMIYKGSDTVGDVLSKIIDEGDKILLGLSRTPNGAILESNELIGTDSEDVTLYAVWEEYDYLVNYSHDFNGSEIDPAFIVANQADKTVTCQDGYMTIGLTAKSGYTGTWDTQIYMPLTTNSYANLDKYVPAGVVTGVAARVRFRGTGTTSQSLTVANKGTNSFNPANPVGTFIHWAAPGNKWSTNLTTYSYDYNAINKLSGGIPDGEWFTLYFDTKTTDNLKMFDSGVGYMRFDFPYPLPTGTQIDVDYIRLVGDSSKVAYDGVGEYGEKVWELNFDKIEAGSLASNKPVLDIGAEFNPAFNGSNYSARTNFVFSSSTISEIVADGTGNYLKYTAGANGTNAYLYLRNGVPQPYVKEDGYFVLTYDVKNETSVAVPHTFRFNNNDKIEHAADNIVITENGEWDHVVVYFDKEINPDKIGNDSVTRLDSTDDVTIVKWHNNPGVLTGETVCMDNIILWYVPKTVPVIIDNSAIDEEETLIAELPTCGITNEELAKLLPVKEGVKFTGLSKTEGGELLYENRVQNSAILYSVWAVDTTLTVDMGDNTKLDDMKIQIPAGSSIKVFDIEAKFIDHGDKIFKGLSLTEGGEQLSSSATIAASESGELTIYALWEDYNTNDFYSIEFMGGIYGVDTTNTNLNPGKNSVYRYDARDASGATKAGTHADSLTWTEIADGDGYVTMNFVASDYAKAQTSAQGMMYAAVYDSYLVFNTVDNNTKYIPKGTIESIVVRMRYRGLPEAQTKAWRADTGASVDVKPQSAHAPFFFWTTSAGEAFGSNSILKEKSVASGSAYRENWFTVTIPASDLNMDENNIYSIRLDPSDAMVDGSAIDIDFIRFVGKSDKANGAPESLEEQTNVRCGAADGRNGIRVKALVDNKVRDDAIELGLMFSATDRWNKSEGGVERNWHELTMDLYNPSSSLILVGFTKENSELQIRDYFHYDDYSTIITAVLYNIPTKNYRSPFIVRPFAKVGNAYAYGEPFEINFLDVIEEAAKYGDEGTVAYYNECQEKYAAYLDANAAYDSDTTNTELAKIMSSPTSVISNLIIPTNDVAPTVTGDIVTMRVWKNGAFATLNVSTKNAYPALLTADNKISEAYAEKPCVYYEANGVYYIKSLGRSTTAGGEYVGIEKSDPSAMEANVDASAMFLSEIKNVESPFQRVPIDDELTNGKDSWFIGDFNTGKFDFTFQRANSATRTIATGKTATFGDKTKMVAKYKYADGSYEWVSYAKSQLLKMGLDSDSVNIAGGIDFNNLTYVVTNNTTTVKSGTVNQREYEDLLLLVGEVNVPEYINAGTSYTTTFNAHQYNTVIVKTNSSASYVTVNFTRNDGVSDSIKSYFYGTTTDGYRLFEVDMSGVATWHSNIKKLSVSSSGTISYVRLIKDPEYYTTDNLASMNRSSIFQDSSFDNGFYVRDMDQKIKKPEYFNYTFANNGATPVWMVDPWYAYDYSDSANKARYELYPKASSTATTLTDDNGTKVVKYNGTKTSTQADGKQYTGDVLSLTLNAKSIYNGKTHEQMKSAGMTYWPHLLIEQSRDICDVDSVANSAGADKIFLEMDIKMTNYSAKAEFNRNSTKQLSFLLYTYLRPKANPNDRIWFGASLCSNGAVDYPTWNRDTGASAYIYCIPQEVVYQGIKNSFYQQVKDKVGLKYYNSGTTSKDWVHISLDVTPYIQTAIDWANREDAFGLGTLTRDDFYFDGVNIGFETHGNIDGTFEIANFNFVAYND